MRLTRACAQSIQSWSQLPRRMSQPLYCWVYFGARRNSMTRLLGSDPPYCTASAQTSST